MKTEVDYMIRNWGRWYVLDDLNTTKVKRLEVDPGCQLSYQKHEKRDEIWYVHSGTGVVILSKDGLEEEQVLLYKGKTIHIPVNTWHQLVNTDKETLTVVEIQFGSECKEHDIIRRPNPDYPEDDEKDRV